MTYPRRFLLKVAVSAVSAHGLLTGSGWLSGLHRTISGAMANGDSSGGTTSAMAVPASDGDHDAWFDRIIQAGGGTIHWPGFPWKLTRRWTAGQFPNGTDLRIEPNPSGGTTIEYSGPVPDHNRRERWGIFEIGNRCTLTSALPRLSVRIACASIAPSLWAVVARGKANWTVADIHGHNMGAVHAMASVENYDDVIMDGRRLNCSHDFRILHCGGDFDRIFDGLQEGIVTVRYSKNWEVRGGSTLRGPHGFQGWGGDARTDGVGQGHMAGAERKCRDGRVVGFHSHDVHGAWVWGSFMENVDFIDCTGHLAGDVGFDFEGSKKCRAVNCSGTDAVNGGLATFFHNEAIAFINCSITSSSRQYPIFRNYNLSQSNLHNLDISIRGGRFRCTDTNGMAAIDTRYGCCNLFTVEGIQGENIRIDTAYNNMHNTQILNNSLLYTRAYPKFSAIRAGFAKSLAGSSGKLPGLTRIHGNVIVTHNEQAPNRRGYGIGGDYGSVAIDVIEDDYNSSAQSSIRNNTIGAGFLTPILLRNWSKNRGMVPQFSVAGNFIGGHPHPDHSPMTASDDGIGMNDPIVIYTDNRYKKEALYNTVEYGKISAGPKR